MRLTASTLALLMTHALGSPGHSAQDRPTQQSASLDALTAADWRQDLRVFVDWLVQKHRSPFHHTSRSDFEAAVAEFENTIPTLSPHETAVGFMRLAAFLGDTHSRVAAPQLKVVPIELEWFVEELRIVRTSPGLRELLGARVFQIGNASAEEALRRVSDVIAHGVNERLQLLFSPFFLRNADVLHALQITPERQRVAFLVDTVTGRRVVTLEATLTAGQASQAGDWIDSVPTAPELPLYRRDTNKNWMTYVENFGLAYVAFNRYGDDKAFQGLSDELELLLQDKRPRRLVVDFRNNPGGDFDLGRWYIVRALMRSAPLLTRGRLFVAIDRSSFSAAFVNALDLRRQANAILVGEEPGERPWMYSDGACDKLPRSGLLACFSTRFFRMMDSDAATIPMDHHVVLTWSDFAAGRDPVMDWILAQPEPRDEAPLRWQ